MTSSWSGQKVWSTWAQWSDYGYLLARTEPVDGPAGISAFILDMRSPGVDVRPLREMTGTTDFNEVFFDEVRIPAANMIGAPGEGWRVAGASLAEERSSVAGRRGWPRSGDPPRGGGPADQPRRPPRHRGQRGAPADRCARRPGPHPAPPGTTHGHQGGPGPDHAGRRPDGQDLVQRAEPRDRRGGAGPPGCPVHGGRGRRAGVRGWALAGRLPLRSCLDHRRRIERDHAQPDRRTRPGAPPGAHGASHDLDVAPRPSAPGPAARATRPGRGRGQRPLPRRREGPARPVEHPGPAAQQLAALRARLPVRDRPRARTSWTPDGTPTTPSAP